MIGIMIGVMVGTRVGCGCLGRIFCHPVFRIVDCGHKLFVSESIEEIRECHASCLRAEKLQWVASGCIGMAVPEFCIVGEHLIKGDRRKSVDVNTRVEQTFISSSDANGRWLRRMMLKCPKCWSEVKYVIAIAPYSG